MLFKTCGVCSSAIEFDVKDNKITDVRFIGGCSGNTQGAVSYTHLDVYKRQTLSSLL